MAKYTASQIANWFLKYEEYKHVSEGSDGITNMKLQKLLYYAQCAHLAMHGGEPLFDDGIEAWAHGPVVPSIYRAYKQYGSSQIPPDPDFDGTAIDEETTSLLRDVYATFGQFSAWKLRNMTHAEAPWKDTDLDQVIPLAKMRDYFAQNYME